MNVKEFVRSVLVQIADGVNAANEDFAEKRISAEVNPAGATDESRGSTHFVSVRDTHEVSFDIAITVEMSGSSEQGDFLLVVPGGIKGAEQGGTSSSNVSRVGFRVPLKLPRPKRQQ